MEAKQFYQKGDVKMLDGSEFECVDVTHDETEGVKHNFTYSFRLRSEVDANRDAVMASTQSDIVAPEELNKPEIEEETLNVR